MSEVKAALLSILFRFHALLESQEQNRVEFDPEWRSICEVGESDTDGMVRWKPVEMQPPTDFQDVEAQIGIVLHEDIKEFYSSYWSAPIEARHSGEVVLLTTVWNQEELAGLKKSIIEHVNIRQEEIGSVTVFIAGTDSDLFFSVDNISGEVLLEEPGRAPRGAVAESLTRFLLELQL